MIKTKPPISPHDLLISQIALTEKLLAAVSRKHHEESKILGAHFGRVSDRTETLTMKLKLESELVDLKKKLNILKAQELFLPLETKSTNAD